MEIAEIYNKYYKTGNVCTDSRSIKEGDIFVALKGEAFNGNGFVFDALNKGAALAIVDEEVEIKSDRKIRVENGLNFLQKLANHHRKVSNFEVVGLTGSNGKTTTKELLNCVLSTQYKCFATQGNFNNHIGVPLTLLSIPNNADLAIVEMGANHEHEIEKLCQIAEPDCGLITNIGMAHLKGFGSFEGVVRAKSELYKYLMAHSKKIYFNAGDSLLNKLIDGYNNSISYGKRGMPCSVEIVSLYPCLKVKLSDMHGGNDLIQTNLFGEYNADNMAAAACVAMDFKIEPANIRKGFEKYVPGNNRSQVKKIGSNTFILDCYNANPTSMEKAIASFGKLPADNKIAILGGMRELGEYSDEKHEKIVQIASEMEFGELLLVGDEFDKINIGNAVKFNSVKKVKDYLENKDISGTFFLVKGSRYYKLEEIVEFDN